MNSLYINLIEVCLFIKAYQTRRLEMGAVDSDFSMKTDNAHPTSQKRVDIAATSNGNLQITKTGSKTAL